MADIITGLKDEDITAGSSPSATMSADPDSKDSPSTGDTTDAVDAPSPDTDSTDSPSTDTDSTDSDSDSTDSGDSDVDGADA
jgi:hypothetical protein